MISIAFGKRMPHMQGKYNLSMSGEPAHRVGLVHFVDELQ